MGDQICITFILKYNVKHAIVSQTTGEYVLRLWKTRIQNIMLVTLKTPKQKVYFLKFLICYTMCPVRAEIFWLSSAHRPTQTILFIKGDEVYAKVLAASWKTVVDTFLNALFRDVTFAQHFQKYFLLQGEPRGAGKGSWGQARTDLRHSCNWSFCFVSVELIKWINCRHFSLEMPSPVLL